MSRKAAQNRRLYAYFAARPASCRTPVHFVRSPKYRHRSHKNSRGPGDLLKSPRRAWVEPTVSNLKEAIMRVAEFVDTAMCRTERRDKNNLCIRKKKGENPPLRT
jgi:hypothetical protein